MASGTGERPLPEADAEAALLGLSGNKSLCVRVGNLQKVTVTFVTGSTANGLISLSNYNQASHALYIYGGTSTGNIGYTDIKTPTTANLTITRSGRTFEVTNRTGYVIYMEIIQFYYGLPTVTTANL